MIAIVGPTGAGKTTMINLLERFYDVTSGKILLEGKDIREIDREQLRGRMAMVLQETWLFSGTIMDNLQYGRLEATQEEVIQAAKMAHADEFITTLPQGYQTLLNEAASNISQGQRQLLTIARAFLANPEILILDEATSMLDPKGRMEVIGMIQKLHKEKSITVISITHDLDEAAQADRIVLMEQGQIQQIGTPEEIFKLGTKLVEKGLDVPFAEKLIEVLREKGLEVPEAYLDEEGLVEWLWTSVLTK